MGRGCASDPFASSRTIGSSAPAIQDPEAATRRAFARSIPLGRAKFHRYWTNIRGFGKGAGPPAVDGYLKRLDPADSRGAVELIYREFCLAEAAGKRPEPTCYFARFPEHANALERLLGLHLACSPSLLGHCVESTKIERDLPEVGDAIGPYVLRRELGRGGFVRVFLAEQSNLENRRVVVKVTTRPTREPWLLARVRHAHIVEIVTHDLVDDGVFRFQLICMPFWGGQTLEAVLAARRERKRHRRSGKELLDDLDGVAVPGYPPVHPGRPAREILAGLSYDQAVAWVGARLAERAGPRLQPRSRAWGRQALEYSAVGRRQPDATGFQPGARRIARRRR